MRHRHRPMPARAAGLAAAAIVLLAAAFTLPSPTTAAAVQELSGPGRVAAAASVTDTTYREFEVDTAVGPSRMTPPVYPAEQRLAGMNGEVIVEFVVDSRGALDPATVKVLRATHASFTAAVRTSLATASFKPAWKNGARVSQLVQMPFVFQLSTPK